MIPHLSHCFNHKATQPGTLPSSSGIEVTQTTLDDSVYRKTSVEFQCCSTHITHTVKCTIFSSLLGNEGFHISDCEINFNFPFWWVGMVSLVLFGGEEPTGTLEWLVVPWLGVHFKYINMLTVQQ